MTNKWWELQILCEPNLEDTIFWRLEKFGVKGTASEKKEQSCLIRAYLHKNQVELLDLAALSLWLRQDALLVNLPTPILQWQLIDEEDWASSWKQHWQPQEIGDRFLIYPAWLPLPEKSDRLLLRLDPGTAFGTGNHMTTQLCLEALEMRLDETSNDLAIADIGCGSGILSIGALLLGASKVYAVDIDPLAINATHSNSQLNQIAGSSLVVEQGSIEQLKQMIEQPLDGFVCNILAEVIIDLIPHFNQITKPKAWGILSGILLNQSQAIADTLEQNGWIVAALWRRKDWCCFNIRRN